MADVSEPRPLDVARLRVLREVGLRGTIAAAARSLGLTASAVSQQLSALEREAGTALVDRTPRGVVLTAAGRALAARAEEVVEVLAAARADLDRLAGVIGGAVRVAAVASAATTFVSAAATAIATGHADLTLSVVVAEPPRAVDLLLRGDVELAVVDEYDYVPLAVPDPLVTEQLLVEPLVAVLPAEWHGPRRPALAALAEENWVMPPDDASCGLAVRSACRTAGFEPRVRWTSDDMHVLTAAVAAGHGVAVLPRLSVPSGVPGLQVRPIAQPRLERRLTTVARPSVLARPAVPIVARALAAAAARA